MKQWLKRGGVTAAATVVATGIVIAALAAGDLGPFSSQPGASASQEKPAPDSDLADAEERKEALEDSATVAVQEEEEERPWLGALLSDYPGMEGVTIFLVFADSPADEAGLERLDVITAVDGQVVEDFGDLLTALRDKKPGDKITLSVQKGGTGEAVDVQVTLGARPEPLRPEPPLAELQGLGFEGFLGGQFSFRDKDGEEHDVTIDAGTVKSISETETELVVTLNKGGEKNFTISDETRIPRRETLGPDDKVVVVSVDGKTQLVTGAGLLPRPRSLPRLLPLHPDAKAMGPFRLHCQAQRLLPLRLLAR